MSGHRTQVEHRMLGPNGWMPNNPQLTVRIYRGLRTAHGQPLDAVDFEQRFDANGWPPDWRGGVYDFHHYHSTAHEVLGVFSGHARLELGGEDGLLLTVGAGDALLLPAGTGHRCVDATDFRVVGAYPAGQAWDICRQAPDAATLARIRTLAAPERDPIDGAPF